MNEQCLDFETIANQIHEENARKRQQDELIKILTGEFIYIDFKCWCNAYNKGEGKNDAKVFAKFLKEEQIEINFWQKKHLAEKYFGYEYEYDYTNNKWKIRRVKDEETN